ncbi:MAG: nucleotidyltransferase family protein [bacterium]|nr:nucleotidyltransferase family protein [bacterium]
MVNLKVKKTICSILVSKNSQHINDLLSTIKEQYWDNAYSFLAFFGLCPLFYYKTRQHNTHIPKHILEGLKNIYSSASAEYVKSTHDLKKILDKVKNHNIDIILIKGIYLSEKYYENPVTRTMQDIDLLIRKDDSLQTAELIQELGYKFNHKFDFETWLKYEKHLPELIHHNKRAIELHCDLKFLKLPGNPEVNINTDDIRSRSEELNIEGNKAYTMSVEDIILHLCMEIVQDKFRQCLIKMLDLHNLISSENINWNKVINRAEEWNITKMLLIVISSVENIFNTNLNDFSNKIIKFKKVNHLIIDAVENHLLTTINTGAQCIENSIIEEFQNKKLTGKIKYLFYGFFSSHVICRTYGLDEKSKKKYFYYLPRALFVIKNYFKKSLHLYSSKKNYSTEETHFDYLQILKWLKE